MTDTNDQLFNECFIDYGRELLDEMALCGIPEMVKAGDYLIQEGQRVRYLPIVLEGAIKVQTQENGQPFLLYYVQPGGTCIISFGHLFAGQIFNFSGVAEVDTRVLLIPVARAREWTIKYSNFSAIIFKEYQKRYDDLLETTKQLICYNLEERLVRYFKNKLKISGSELSMLSHKVIAADLGTSREVISRLLKKLEKDGLVEQKGRKISFMLK